MTDTMKELIDTVVNNLKESVDFSPLHDTFLEKCVTMNFYFPNTIAEDGKLIKHLLNGGTTKKGNWNESQRNHDFIVTFTIDQDCGLDENEIYTTELDVVNGYVQHVREVLMNIVNGLTYAKDSGDPDAFIVHSAVSTFMKNLLDCTMLEIADKKLLDDMNAEYKRPTGYLLPGDIDSTHIFMKILYHICEEKDMKITMEELEAYLLEVEKMES